MTMDVQRRAVVGPHEFVEWPRQDHLPADATLPANHPCWLCCKPRSEHVSAPKSSMDSLVERVRALEEGLDAAHRSLMTIAQQRAGDGVDLLGYARNRAEAAYRVLHGPPDPDRDRESRSEVERPDVSTEEVER